MQSGSKKQPTSRMAILTRTNGFGRQRVESRGWTRKQVAAP